MDVQRAKKKGKPNLWVVIVLTNEAIRANLKEVQEHLESKYRTARSELRQGFTDLNSSDIHVTLLGICSHHEKRTEQVKRILSTFNAHIESQDRDLSFELELKGLGSWMTKSENIVLYADFTKQSCAHIKNLAKEIRDFLQEQIAKEELENPFNEEIKFEEESGSQDQESSEEKKSSQEESESVEDESKSKESKDESEDSETSEDNGSFNGLWMDDPKPDIYVPHVTILNSDPKTDRKLRQQIIEKKAKTSRKGDKRNKRGGRAGEKGFREEKAQRLDDREKDPFGWNYSLLRDTRAEFSKISFGTQMITHVELQRGYKCFQSIPLSPQKS